uniref:PS II complex 12 kDa extrinsic protein n=1 Tax=Ditylum brightwellii TaxID=49249 RepID=A0A6V2PN63_9STRA|mmetsp:Transcript_19640/g.28791  ORF Transcript_19640/g.28791 Transcript_19640/m.28791 type:complete len:169 (+) Transcript_19640:62-568(+)
MMKPSSLRRFFFLIACALIVTLGITKADDSSNNPWGIVLSAVEPFQEKYSALPPKGKLASGAFVGYVGSRLTVRAVVSAIKISGAAYIASEVLDYTGYLRLPELSSETEEALEKVKIAAKRFVNQWRIQVRHYLNPDNIKAYIKKALETDSMTTMGLALGAFLGFLLG